MPTRINTLKTLAAAKPKAHTMPPTKTRDQPPRVAAGRVGSGSGGGLREVPLALNGELSRCARRRVPLRRMGRCSNRQASKGRIIESALPRLAALFAAGERRVAAVDTVSCGKRNCEMFQALFRASVNHNEAQTSVTVLRWDSRALLLGFK